MKETKGERIVKLLSKAFKGSCGDFGGKDPYVDGDEITLYSQIDRETYRFNDDGSVDNLTDFSDIIDNESAWDDYGIESEDEAREYFESISHFDSVEDLFNSGLSWFMDVPNSEKLLREINNILKDDTIDEEKEDVDNVEEYKEKWINALDSLKSAYNELQTLMTTTNFDSNEFINTKDAQELMNNSFANSSLDELAIADWCEEVKNNLEKWKPGEWLEEETNESLKESKGLTVRDVKPGQVFKPLKDLFYCDIKEEGMFEDDEELVKEFTDNGFKLEGTSLIIPAETIIKFAVSQSVDSYEIGDYAFDVGEWSEEAENTPVEIISSSITEAPDEDGIMSDDELDAQEKAERDEFEARLKARRDKVAQQRADRDAKVAREQELKAKAQSLVDEIGGDWQFEHLFDVLVPSSGKCDTLAGELIRAINKIEYRWFNDGDRWFEDYGIETAGPAAMFVINFENDDETPYYDFMIEWAEDNSDDDEYDTKVEQLKNSMSAYIENHHELLAMETKDMYDINYRDVEEWLRDHNLIPTYEYDSDIPDELQAHLDRGHLSERELKWEIESWIENVGCYDSDVSVSDYVYIDNLDKAAYDELNGNLYRWLEDYASELTDEYGDPYEEDEEEGEN